MWAHLIIMFLGIWLMAAPALIGYDGLPADHDYVVGPIIASLACVALWEVTRPLRWVNLVLGIWLLIAPWLMKQPFSAAMNSVAIGAATALLSLVPGKRRHRFGGGWSALWRSDPSG